MSKGKEKDTAIPPELEPEEGTRDRKWERFFNHFKDQNNFVITLYRDLERGAREALERYENRIPDFIEIRETFGAGKYTLYAHDFDWNFLNSATINIGEAGKRPGGAPAESLDAQKQQWLDELLKYKALFGGGSGGGNTEHLILEMMKFQGQATQKMTEMISTVQENALKAQVEQEKRFAQLFQAQQGKKTELTEIMAVMDFVEKVRGGGGSDETLLEKVLTSPVTQAAVSYLTAPAAAPAVGAIPAPSGSAPAQKRVSDMVPKDFLAQVTPETKDQAIQAVLPHVGNDQARAAAIIEQILREKGAA